MPTGYSSDLSLVHEAGFTAYAEAAAGLIIRELGQHTGNDLVVDLGCGGGTLARLLVDAGFDVVGIDISPSMIELARARVPEATFIVESFREAPMPPCIAVTAIGEVFNYLFERTMFPETLSETAGRIFRALEPGGIFLFDLAGPTRGTSRPQRAEHSGDGWRVEVDIEEHDGILLRHLRTIRFSDGEEHLTDETHRLALFDPSNVQADLEDIGFEVTRLDAYGPQASFLPGWHGFLARRP